MKLNNQEVGKRSAYEEKGFKLPQYNRQEVAEETLKNPTWIHFGAGNIFRAFPAAVWQKLLNEGKVKTGIIVGEGYDYELIDKAYKPYDDLSLLVTLKPDGQMEKEVIGSVVHSLKVDTEVKQD